MRWFIIDSCKVRDEQVGFLQRLIVRAIRVHGRRPRIEAIAPLALAIPYYSRGPVTFTVALSNSVQSRMLSSLRLPSRILQIAIKSPARWHVGIGHACETNGPSYAWMAVAVNVLEY